MRSKTPSLDFLSTGSGRRVLAGSGGAAANIPPFWCSILLFGAALELNMVLLTLPNLFSYQILNIFVVFCYFPALCTHDLLENSRINMHIATFKLELIVLSHFYRFSFVLGPPETPKRGAPVSFSSLFGFSWAFWRPLRAILAATWCLQAAHSPPELLQGSENASQGAPKAPQSAPRASQQASQQA